MDLIKNFAIQDKAVIMISHNLEELLEHSDRVVVMKDGVVVGTYASKKMDVNKLKRLMIGREIEGDYYRDDDCPSYKDEVVLSAKNISTRDNSLKNISFDLHKGEILGICGLSDSGTHLLGKVLFGLDKITEGVVSLRQKELHRQSDFTRSNIGYCPKDRDFDGLMLNTSIRNNLCIPSLGELRHRSGYISIKSIDDLAEKISADFDIKSTGIDQIVNKQKVNLGRWMSKDLEIFILDCPTRGVDVGVKAYIYNVMKKAKAMGLSMILITDELTEAIGLSDRLIILKNGEISGLINRGDDMNEESIIKVMI